MNIRDGIEHRKAFKNRIRACLSAIPFSHNIYIQRKYVWHAWPALIISSLLCLSSDCTFTSNWSEQLVDSHSNAQHMIFEMPLPIQSTCTKSVSASRLPHQLWITQRCWNWAVNIWSVVSINIIVRHSGVVEMADILTFSLTMNNGMLGLSSKNGCQILDSDYTLPVSLPHQRRMEVSAAAAGTIRMNLPLELLLIPCTAFYKGTNSLAWSTTRWRHM